MTKTILITGATDGIGLLTAKTLTAEGHNVLLHGRSADKLEAAAREVGGNPETYRADLSLLEDANALVADVRAKHDTLDVLINNAGVLKVPNTQTDRQRAGCAFHGQHNRALGFDRWSAADHPKRRSRGEPFLSSTSARQHQGHAR